MVRQELVDFVVNWLKQGQSLEDIQAALASGGYSHVEINETITLASEKYTAELKELKFGKEKPVERRLPEKPRKIERLAEKPVEKPSASAEREASAKAAAEMRRLHAEGARHIPPKERKPPMQDLFVPELEFKPPSNLPYIIAFVAAILIVVGAAYFLYISLTTPTIPPEFALVPADSNLVMFIDIKKFNSDKDVQEALKEYYTWLENTLGMPALYNESAIDEGAKPFANISKMKLIVFFNMNRFIASINSSSYNYYQPREAAAAPITLKGIGAILFLDANNATELKRIIVSNETISSREYGGQKIYYLEKWPETNYSEPFKNTPYSPSPLFSEQSLSNYNPLTIYDSKAFGIAFLDEEIVLIGTMDEVEAVLDVKNGKAQNIGSRADFREAAKDIDSTGLFSMTFVLNEEELKEFQKSYGGAEPTRPSEFKELKLGFSFDKTEEDILLKAVFFAPNETAAKKTVETIEGGIKTFRGMTSPGSAAEAMLNSIKISYEGAKIKISSQTTVTQIKKLIDELKEAQRASLLKQIQECNKKTDDYSREWCYSSALYSISEKTDCDLITDSIWRAKCIGKVSAKDLSGLEACGEFASATQKDACISEAISTLSVSDLFKLKNYSYPQLSSNCEKIVSREFKDDCFKSAATYSLNSNGCAAISNSTARDNCYYLIASVSLNSSLCEFISGNLTRSSCLHAG